MEPKVSVIVPAYNVEQWLRKTLDSITAQTYPNLEILVVDDGSTDGTAGIIDEYALRDSRIVPIHQKNGGLVAARETGIAHATGDYVTFVDGDDTIEPDMHERLMANALKYDADISHCGMCFLFPDGRREMHHGTGVLQVHDNFEGLQALLTGELVEPSLCNKVYAAHLVKDSCLDRTVCCNEDLLRNFTLFSRARRSVFEDFCGYNYFQRSGSISHNDDKQLVNTAQYIQARKLILDNSSGEVRPYAMRLWLSTYVDFLNQNYKSKDPSVQAFYTECRQILKRERKNIPFLIRRQQIAAYLLLYAPWLHHTVYDIYQSRR